jgi:voltage-dependent potassium channel beta subunit
MDYRQMGRSGLQLSILGLGSWISFHNQVGDQAAEAIMGKAYDAGINFFDNAEVYANGESEQLMGRVLKKMGWERSSYVLSSKAFFGWHKDNKPNQKGLSRKHLKEACDEALGRLQTDYLDLYYCHRPDESVPMEEIVWTMHQLIQAGKVLYWGTSEWSAGSIIEAHEVAERYRLIGPSVEQPEYNLFRREKVQKEFLPLYNAYGLGLTTWSPLASGMLTGKYNNGIPEGSRLSLPEFKDMKGMAYSEDRIQKARDLKKLADDWKVSMADLSIVWVLKNPRVTSCILGASKIEQLEQNLNALTLMDFLTPERIKQVETVTADIKIPTLWT